MAVTVTVKNISIFPVCNYVYTVTGLVTGANTITTPTPPAAGSFPPAADWTPVNVLCFPINAGAVGATVTPDLSTISNSAGVITVTVYASGSTSCLMIMM